MGSEMATLYSLSPLRAVSLYISSTPWVRVLCNPRYVSDSLKMEQDALLCEAYTSCRAQTSCEIQRRPNFPTAVGIGAGPQRSRFPGSTCQPEGPCHLGGK